MTAFIPDCNDLESVTGRTSGLAQSSKYHIDIVNPKGSKVSKLHLAVLNEDIEKIRKYVQQTHKSSDAADEGNRIRSSSSGSLFRDFRSKSASASKGEGVNGSNGNTKYLHLLNLFLFIKFQRKMLLLFFYVAFSWFGNNQLSIYPLSSRIHKRLKGKV